VHRSWSDHGLRSKRHVPVPSCRVVALWAFAYSLLISGPAQAVSPPLSIAAPRRTSSQLGPLIAELDPVGNSMQY